MSRSTDLECCGLAGKAGGLRTAATILRCIEQKGGGVSLSWIAEQLEEKANEVDAQALALLPMSEAEKQ